MHPKRLFLALLAATGGLAPAVQAQSNVIPGTDVSLGILSNLSHLARQGTFPNGMNAFAMATTSCNLGSVNVPWSAPMDEDHPFIAFMIVREDASGRLFQISDRSYIKHGFFALSNSQCIPCQVPSDGTFLGIGCSDTYSVSNNADNFWLGPAIEIDPWLGEWEATCSFFDAGLSPQPSTQCDGDRTFSFLQAGSLGPIGNRVRVADADLLPNGPTNFYYASYYVIRGEPEAARTNNLASRPFTADWNGSTWQIQTSGPQTNGTVLDRWTGATVRSNTNGTSDGRVYVASKVTGPDAHGLYHYEYALHNRDNARGVGSVRLPLCPGTPVADFGFHDLDDFAVNDWTLAVEGGELVVGAGNNPLLWNTLYNFWFDSPAAPVLGSAQLTAFFPGGGAPQFAVDALVPGPSAVVTSGPGCAVDAPPVLAATGAPALGSASFALELTGVDPSAAFLLYGSATPGSFVIDGCTVHLGGAIGAEIVLLATSAADGLGASTMPMPVPNDPALDGLTLGLQVLAFTNGGPAPLLGSLELSNGLLVRFGSAPAACL